MALKKAGLGIGGKDNNNTDNTENTSHSSPVVLQETVVLTALMAQPHPTFTAPPLRVTSLVILLPAQATSSSLPAWIGGLRLCGEVPKREWLDGIADSSSTVPAAVLSYQLGGKELLELLHADLGLRLACAIQDEGICK